MAEDAEMHDRCCCPGQHHAWGFVVDGDSFYFACEVCGVRVGEEES